MNDYTTIRIDPKHLTIGGLTPSQIIIYGQKLVSEVNKKMNELLSMGTTIYKEMNANDRPFQASDLIIIDENGKLYIIKPNHINTILTDRVNGIIVCKDISGYIYNFTSATWESLILG